MLTTLIRARRGALVTSALGCAALPLSACSTTTTGAGAGPRAVSQGFIANAAGACADPWINSAYAETFGRAPSGSGNAGECNVNVYGGGSLTGYDDLQAEARQRLAALDRQGLLLRSTGAAVVSGKVFNPNQVAIISGSTNQVPLASSPRLLPVDGTTVVRIVAAGGGSIVAAGGGN